MVLRFVAVFGSAKIMANYDAFVGNEDDEVLRLLRWLLVPLIMN